VHIMHIEAAGGSVYMYFPKSFAIGIATLVLIFAVGLGVYIYFQGGVDSAIHLGGW
jgi:hypothetical protein